jgi:hypothetical protein
MAFAHEGGGEQHPHRAAVLETDEATMSEGAVRSTPAVACPRQVATGSHVGA